MQNKIDLLLIDLNIVLAKRDGDQVINILVFLVGYWKTNYKWNGKFPGTDYNVNSIVKYNLMCDY